MKKLKLHKELDDVALWLGRGIIVFTILAFCAGLIMRLLHWLFGVPLP